jgi:insulysin
MILPKNETRIFETEVLQNGIKTVFVNDPSSNRTIVSVAVSAGSLSNPKEYQGLAHFLEHMLFLGSKKYPNENHYENAVHKYGGNSNAFTDSFETVYYFTSFNNGLEEILDIFSRFFIDPLFKEDAVNREINAINSEHQKNINNDNWREYQLVKNLSKKDCAYNSFATGNKKTLAKEGLRDKMIEFWEKYYITTNLGICIVSNMKISQQKKLIGKTFGKIEKRNGEKFKLVKPLFDSFNKTYQMIPTSEIQNLNYYWEIPVDDSFMRNKLFMILGDLLVKNEKHSYINYLKVNGLIEDANTSIREFEGIFELSFNLTQLGLKNLNLIDGTLKYEFNKIFSQDWNKIVAYYKKLYKINFDNSAKIESLPLAIKLCENLHRFPINDVYVGELLVLETVNNPVDLIRKYFDNHFKILILKSDAPNLKIDEHYGTKYCEIKNIKSEPIIFNSKINLDNPFFDMKPELIENLNCETPVLIREKTWYGGCSKFNEAVIEGSFILSSQKFFNTEINYLLTILMDKCLSFYLNQELFNILTLKFHISIIPRSIYNCVIFQYRCPSDPIKFNQFINKTIELIKTATIPSKVVQSKMENLKEELLNINKKNPWEYITYYHNKINQSNEYLHTKLLKTLETITEQQVINFINNIFEDCSLTMFFYGNLTYDQMPSNPIINKLIFYPQPIFPKINFNENITISHPNPNEKNNCVCFYFYVGPFAPIKWLHLFFVHLILENIFFDQLRTKKQLGYLVRLSLINMGDNYYMTQKIQSGRSCKEIIVEIDKFNNNIIKTVNDCNLDEWKISAKNYLKEKENSNNDFYTNFFSEIISRKYLFHRKKIVSTQIKNISKESIIEFINEYIFNNKYKSIICIKGNK